LVKEVHEQSEDHASAAAHDEGGRWVIESGQKQIKRENAHSKEEALKCRSHNRVQVGEG
jgi:hypothetical protein